MSSSSGLSCPLPVHPAVALAEVTLLEAPLPLLLSIAARTRSAGAVPRSELRRSEGPRCDPATDAAPNEKPASPALPALPALPASGWHGRLREVPPPPDEEEAGAAARAARAPATTA